MLDKIFSKKKKQEDIFSIPQRKNPVDLKNVAKLGPKALQQIVQQEQKYISILVGRIEEIKTQHYKINDKAEELKQKNDVINAQISKMSNEHEQLTIKFDNLQNSLQIMISTSQQQLNAQLSFIKSHILSLSPQQAMPKSMQQVFTLYQDRFQLCSKIGQQNKFLKEKITEIQLKFDEIKERYEEAEKEKGFNSLIPELMVSLEELKRERKNSNSLPRKPVIVAENIEENTQEKPQEENVKALTKEAQTMTNQEKLPQLCPPTIYSQTQKSECYLCKELSQQIQALKQSLNKQIQQLTEEKQSLVQEVAQWSQKYESLQRILASIKQDRHNLENESSQKEKEVKLLREEIEGLEKSLMKERETVEGLQKEVKEFQKMVGSLREENTNLSKEIQKKQYEIVKKQGQFISLAQRLAQQNKNNNTTQNEKVSEPGQQTSQNNGTQHISSSLPQSPTAALQQFYQQKLTILTSQNDSNLQQILTLKQSLTQKQSQIILLSSSLNKTESNLTKLKESLTHSEEMTNQLESKYKKMMEENEEEMMAKIKSLQVKSAENQKQLVYLRNFKVGQEQEVRKVVKEKKILQEKCQELDGYKNDVEGRILPQLRSQLQVTKKQYQRVTQEKQVIQQHNLENMNQLNTNYQSVLKQKDSLTKEKSDMETKIVTLQKDNTSKLSEIESFEQMINKLNLQMTDKLLQIQKVSDQLKAKSQQTQQLYEQLRSKQRKYQSELNQQRIKLQTSKRTISVQETKLQEYEKSSNKFYEESMHKDKKINYMEGKLKEYKHLIQSLKKEKEEVEKSYREKIKTYEESIAEVVSEDQATSERKRTQESSKGESKNGGDNGNMLHMSGGEAFSSDKDAEYFRNQIMSYEQSNLILTEQNAALREQIKQLEQEMQDRRKQVENLQQKREQTLKQIQKLNLRSINGSLQQTSTQFLQKQKQFLKEKEQFDAFKQKSEQRTKKIALKAYKGFDILLKKHQNLYKEFMAVFVKEIEHREEVKSIESEINMLVNKSTDMKDVFQDYL